MIVNTNDIEIPTWTEPETLEYCAQVARRSSFMVECGVYMGASSRAMLRAHYGLHLWAVDKFMVFGTEQITRMFLRDWIDAGQCEIIVGDSEKAGEMLQHMKGRIDAVWCDDGHAVGDLQRDIRCLMPLVRSGGIIFGHDFDKPYNDVAQGVMSMIPLEKLTFPVPRVWQYQVP